MKMETERREPPSNSSFLAVKQNRTLHFGFLTPDLVLKLADLQVDSSQFWE